MGFFKKIFKGVKKVFKSIGKRIKKVAMAIGKVVNKLGIVGQIAMMFILPGVGGILAKAFGGLTAGLLGSANVLLRGVGHILATAGKFAATAGNVFKTVTKGISSFVTKVGGKVLEKVGLKAATEGSLGEAFKGWMNGVAKDTSNILSPWTKTNLEFATGLSPKPTAAKASQTTAEKSFVETSSIVASERDLENFGIDASQFKFDKELGLDTLDVLKEKFSIDKDFINQTTTEIHNDFINSDSKTLVGDWVGEARDSFIDNVKEQFSGENIGQLIFDQALSSFGSEEQFEEPSGQVAPVFSQQNPLVAFDNRLQQQGFGYGGPINAAQFQTNFASGPAPEYLQALSLRT